MEQIITKRLKNQQNDLKRRHTAPDEAASENSLIVNCLVDGMCLNLATLCHGSTYKTDTGGEECSIHPSSVLFGQNLTNKNKQVPSMFEQNDSGK